MLSNEPENRSIQRALAAVDAHLNRTDSVNEERRSHQRQRVRQRVRIYESTAPDSAGVEGWSYNISRGGLGFVSASEIPLGDVAICINPDSDTDTDIWMRARIRRRKDVIDGIFDYGAEFRGRADPISE